MQPNDWRREIYRASRLDEFRYYLAGEHFDGSEYTSADFIKRMTEKHESPQMAAGTAVHKVIEDAAFGDIPEHVDCQGWRIHFDLNANMGLPTIRETELFREHNGIPLFGRVDAMDAFSVHDIKTTANIDIDRYMDSYQWKSYLWMSGRRWFVYDILRVKLDEEAKLCSVLEYMPVTQSWYPALDHHVQELLVDFDAAIRALKIPEIMREKLAA